MTTRLRPVLGSLVLAGLLLAVLPAAGPAGAQTTFTVSANRITGLAATDDPAPDGTCDADCSLREAVQAANATPAADTITFATGGTVALGRSGTEAGNASFNDLDVTQDLTVSGHADGTTIDATALTGAQARVFEVDEHALTLTDLTLVGDGGASSSVAEGGGIRMNEGQLTLTRVTMRDFASADLGGAVLADNSRVTVTDSAFADNGVANTRGAITASGGPTSITGSVFTGNGGGAVELRHDDAGGPLPGTHQATLTNSTFDGNEDGVWVLTDVNLDVDSSTFSDNASNGIFVITSAAGLSVTNSTFSNNSAGTGFLSADIVIGALFFPEDPNEPAPPGAVDATVVHSTFVGNQGDASILVADDDSSATVSSSLFGDGGGDHCIGPVISTGYNLEDAAECPFTQTGDLQDTDPGVAPLADNNGRAQGPAGDVIGQTHALTAESAALHVADPALCPSQVNDDERGVARPIGPGCDIGAFELGGGSLTITKDVAPGTIQPGGTATFTIVVTNDSGTPVADAGMSDVVPDGLSVQSVTPSDQCPTPTGQTVTCDLGTLAPGASATIGLAVNGDAPGNYVNTAAATVAGETVDEGDAPLVVATGEGCSGTGTGGGGIDEGVTRIQGLNRIQTSIAASQAACGEGEAPAVVLTRQDLFPDAQAGTPLAVSLGAPLLLSAPESLSPEAEEEILRVLEPGGTVYLLGGTAALSEAVEARIQALGFTTIRYGGINRFETATIIADQGLGNPGTLLAANGGDFADSIVAGAAAVNVGEGQEVDAAVILTSGGDVPPETQAYLDGRGQRPVLIAVGALAGQAFPNIELVGTADRFETSVAVANRFFEAPRIVGVARGDEFPDGLSGGSLVGRQLYGPGPILFTNTDSLPAGVQGYLGDNAAAITRALIFGGTAAISTEVEQQIRTTLS